MRLNSSGFNASAINANTPKRFSVSLEGVSVIGTQVEITPTRKMRFSGEAVGPTLSLSSAVNVYRFLTGGIDFSIEPSVNMLPSVYRACRGDAIIKTGTSLYYVKQIYGYGSAILAISSKGDVGVEFGKGDAVISDLLTVSFDGAKVKRFAGDIAMSSSLSMTASAIRRPSVYEASIRNIVLTELDSSATIGGIKYVGMFGDTVIAITSEDAGMLRQASIGVIDIPTLVSVGALTVKRNSLRGDAIIDIGTDMNGAHVIRNGYGNVNLLTLSEGDCDIVVLGDGTVRISIDTEMTGYVYRFSLAGESNVSIDSGLNGYKFVPFDGEIINSLLATGTLGICRMGHGAAIIDALSFSSGVVNADREDIDSHVFYKSALDRELIKPAIEREFYTAR
jgi:hypothetical protein